MNPPPPSPATYGSVTPRVALAATAASIALPPLLRIPIAVLVASLSTDAAAPPVPVATAWDCAAAAAGNASATSRTTVATTRCPMPARYPGTRGTKRSPLSTLGPAGRDALSSRQGNYRQARQ